MQYRLFEPIKSYYDLICDAIFDLALMTKQISSVVVALIEHVCESVNGICTCRETFGNSCCHRSLVVLWW